MPARTLPVCTNRQFPRKEVPCEGPPPLGLASQVRACGLLEQVPLRGCRGGCITHRSLPRGAAGPHRFIYIVAQQEASPVSELAHRSRCLQVPWVPGPWALPLLSTLASGSSGLPRQLGGARGGHVLMCCLSTVTCLAGLTGSGVLYQAGRGRLLWRQSSCTEFSHSGYKRNGRCMSHSVRREQEDILLVPSRFQFSYEN